MNKQKKFLVLAIVSLLTVVSLAAGCAGAPTLKPTINSFTASPESIVSGQRSTLSWDVSGATEISIEPGVGIGTLGASGSLQLSPPNTITYTLTATNKAGSTTGSATITVTPAVTGKPDLVITDVSLVAETVYFTIKNQGDAPAGQTWTDLYVYGTGGGDTRHPRRLSQQLRRHSTSGSAPMVTMTSRKAIRLTTASV
jgi:hypothetical protein